MSELIIVSYEATKQGVILETNIPARLKTGNTAQERTFVSWDKIGQLLFDNYTEESDISVLRKLRKESE